MDALLNAVMSLRNSGVNPEQIIKIVADSGCSLEMILYMEDTHLIRAMFECPKWKQMSPEQRSHLITFAMSSDYLQNKKTYEQSINNGSKAIKTKIPFLKTLESMLGDLNIDLDMIMWIIKQLMKQNLVDRNVLALVQRTFNDGTEKAVQILLDCDIDLHVKNKFGLDLKAHLFGNRNYNVNNLLRREKFDLNAKGKAQFRALHFAAKKNIIENVELLLKAGADPNSRDEDGASPLFVAQSEECIALLLQYGIDIEAVCDYGYTVFDVFFEGQKNVLIAHLVLIKATNTPVKQEIYDRVLRDTEINDVYMEYSNQLEWMKRKYIKKSFTLFALLVEKVEILVRHVRDKELISKFLDSCERQKVCWYYTFKLKRNLEKAFTMHSLQCKAAQVIAENIVVLDCNHLVTKKIVDMLSFEDLQLFV